MNYKPYAEIAELFPIQPAPSKASLIRYSKLGKFPPYIRPFNQKSPPLWDAEAVTAWIEANYAPFFKTKKAQSAPAKRPNKFL